MQDVLLPDGARIPKGAEVVGRIVAATPGQSGTAARVGVTFDRLRMGGREIAITTHLRALASMNEVFQAKLPTNSFADYGTSTSDWNTVQVGGAGVFRGINGPFQATRYHSLVIDRASLPDVLTVTAEADDQLIMGASHKQRPVHGVQFHPESIASEHGHLILKNFLDLAAQWSAAHGRATPAPRKQHAL